VQVHYFPTPNGWKVSIALEEMGLPYELKILNILEGEQLAPEFLKLSPNGRIPAIVDEDDNGEAIRIFESGAILQYLARKSGRFYGTREAQRCWIDAWLFWQMAGLGPMAGQLSWFIRVSQVPDRDPRDSSYPIHRYRKEVRRLYAVLETQLTGRDFICDDYSIADMASWPWVHQYHHQMGDIEEFPAIAAWYRRVAERPAVQRALELGKPAQILAPTEDG
jgi:glutathione S-transferase/GST-like protein